LNGKNFRFDTTVEGSSERLLSGGIRAELTNASDVTLRHVLDGVESCGFGLVSSHVNTLNNVSSLSFMFKSN
jgi:hypothetical protein